MEDTAKYLIRADISADGVVERSDVVGAVFGQTEGLLGSALDIRDLQQSSKLGRIDVEIGSEGGRSQGTITIASNLDRVETAVLAAALETIDRVGPCEAAIRVREITDSRAAKREAVVERATELLADDFSEAPLGGDDVVDAVRESTRAADVTKYEGYPAGPRVRDGDAIVLVEGRSDVLALLKAGIKNAVAVEGTNVPDAVADLTRERTTTAFLDGDRGGDLILRELVQVAALDYVARAPEGESVEDLTAEAMTDALREKVRVDVAIDRLADGEAERGDRTGQASEGQSEARRDADAETADVTTEAEPADPTPADAETDGAGPVEPSAAPPDGPDAEPTGPGADPGEAGASPGPGAASPAAETESDAPVTLADHVAATREGGTVRVLDADLTVLVERDAGDAVAAVEDAGATPHAVVLDGTVTQRLLDVSAQRGVTHVVGRERGEFTKQPVAVRVRSAADLLEEGTGQA